MYIKEQDFKYFENLSKELDEKNRERFKELLVEACSEKTGKRDIGKIKVINAILHLNFLSISSPAFFNVALSFISNPTAFEAS